MIESSSTWSGALPPDDREPPDDPVHDHPAVHVESAPLIDVRSNELAELKDRHLRLQAEFENFRKRKLREADEVRNYAGVPIIESILDVLGHLDLALDPSHDRSDPQWSEGIDIIARQLFEALKIFGLEEIKVSRGDKFDHEFHEAIATGKVPPPEGTEPGIEPDGIIQVVRKGYKFKDKVIRHAHVVVAEDATQQQQGANAKS